ncbi:MAG: IS607 family transposase [Candidatus Dormibacteraeota bacterium]|nr:IS607 family transposase [Candidatus Dormibacteraeota bacterium]
MKLSDWARQQGVHPKTALRWYDRGLLPVPAHKVGPRTILVDTVPSGGEGEAVALYARVSSHDRKGDLEQQVGRLTEWAKAQGLQVVETVSEVGSGMNGSRTKLRRLLADGRVRCIVVEHRDRLTRLGSEYIEAALQGGGRRLVIVEPGEVAEELVGDMTEVLTSLCARRYGRRSARTRAARALRASELSVGSEASGS